MARIGAAWMTESLHAAALGGDRSDRGRRAPSRSPDRRRAGARRARRPAILPHASQRISGSSPGRWREAGSGAPPGRSAGAARRCRDRSAGYWPTFSLKRDLKAVIGVVAVEHRGARAGDDALDVTDQQRLGLLLGGRDLQQFAQLLLTALAPVPRAEPVRRTIAMPQMTSRTRQQGGDRRPPARSRGRERCRGASAAGPRRVALELRKLSTVRLAGDRVGDGRARSRCGSERVDLARADVSQMLVLLRLLAERTARAARHRAASARECARAAAKSV